MTRSVTVLPAEYGAWLASLKQRIQGARQRAVLAANAEQIRLYHDIGREILERQDAQGWGARVIDRLSADLRAAFPEMKGFSVRNLNYMRLLGERCPDRLFVQQSAAQLPWFHIFAQRLPASQADLALRILKDGGDEFFIDLLFYHTRLKCHVVVELKATAFKPEHAGQLNFYLSTVDAGMKAHDDRPTIGLLLCRTQNRLVAEYALSGIDKPIGVAEYQLVRALPEPLDASLPGIEEIEAEMVRGLEGVEAERMQRLSDHAHATREE